ncbi:MAG: hypothetical protein EPO55_14225 [Reyranella sp.]|uniref:hypothetical protein n=1 Tax=Reyranella sp. TaxID=1929291 RepID=UPI0011F54645|nr:hypothetical protein [Reyranella sp.]TAJ38929.1 MAG: hypothetical protein EPO55_14225 [Reyranella sp.]
MLQVQQQQMAMQAGQAMAAGAEKLGRVDVGGAIINFPDRSRVTVPKGSKGDGRFTPAPQTLQ